MDATSEPANAIDSFARDHLPPRESWPELIFALPELRYPRRLNCVTQFLERWITEGRGHALCLIGEHESLTYRQLFERVNRIANVLVNRLGLRPGSRVLLRSGNTPMMVAAYLAVLKAGGVVVATMPLLRAREIAYPVNKARIVPDPNAVGPPSQLPSAGRCDDHLNLPHTRAKLSSA